VSILHVYSLILAGWASQSRYSFFGALRSSAQLIAYDISMVFVLLNIVLYTKSLNLTTLVKLQAQFGWFIIYFPLLFIIFFICALAETNRHPFDLPEAEAELVSGYNVEYSAIPFALLFLGEYSSIIFMSIFIVNIFLGGWTVPFIHYLLPVWLTSILSIIIFIIKIMLFCYLFILFRAMLPRYRYDQLMKIGWKITLPGVILLFLINSLLLFFLSLSNINWIGLKVIV
jgi:NADH-quinone oxidoreductase subunit H